MSTDKRKPIPSPKHTLDDVLKTLQDLVRNELADEHVGRGRPPRVTPRVQDEFDGDAPTTSPAATPSTDTAAARTTVAAQADTDIEFSSAPLPAPAADETGGRIDAADAPDVSAEPTHVGEDVSTAAAVDLAGATEGRTDTAQLGPEQTHINWDDIPVLNEVVDLPPQVAPAAPNARTVAVRVVARLNIELRAAGTAPLDPAIIDRLEHLLREALDPNAAPGEQ